MFVLIEKSQQKKSTAAVTLPYDYGDMTTRCETDIEGYKGLLGTSCFVM